MVEGGIVWWLVSFVYIFVGFICGGLLLVNIVVLIFFGVILGLLVVDMVFIGLVMIFEMDKKGYLCDFVVVVIVSGFV